MQHHPSKRGSSFLFLALVVLVSAFHRFVFLCGFVVPKIASSPQKCIHMHTHLQVLSIISSGRRLICTRIRLPCYLHACIHTLIDVTSLHQQLTWIARTYDISFRIFVTMVFRFWVYYLGENFGNILNSTF
jgi:hypothetical protein